MEAWRKRVICLRHGGGDEIPQYNSWLRHWKKNGTSARAGKAIYFLLVHFVDCTPRGFEIYDVAFPELHLKTEPRRQAAKDTASQRDK